MIQDSYTKDAKLSPLWPEHLMQGDLTSLEQLIAKLNLNWDEDRVREFMLPDAWHANTEV